MDLALSPWMVLYVPIFIYSIIVHEPYSTTTGVYTGIFRYNRGFRMSYGNTARRDTPSKLLHAALPGLLPEPLLL